MAKIRLPLPLRGASNATAYIDTPGDVAPAESVINVRRRRKGSGRQQVGSRPGWRRIMAYQAANPQACGVISRASGISGFQASARVALGSGYVGTIGQYRTQCVVLDTDRSVLRTFHDSRATAPALTTIPAAGPGGPGGFYACWHSRDPDVAYFGTLTIDTAHVTSGAWICGLSRVHVPSGTITHQTYVVDADPGYSVPLGGTPADVFPNVIRQHGPYLYVAARHHVYVYHADTLSYLGRTAVPWAVEVQDIRIREYGGRHYVLALYSGSVVATGPVVWDTGAGPFETFGEHFRAGIHCFAPVYGQTHPVLGFPPVAYSAWAGLTFPPASEASAVTPGQTTLYSLPLITGRAASDPYYEAHQGYRISEWSASRSAGIGRIPYSFAVDSQMRAYVTTANQGFGPDPLANAVQRPNGPANVSADNPYITIGRHLLGRAFESDGPVLSWSSMAMDPAAAVRYGCGEAVGGWERDIDRGSYRRTYSWNGGTYRCDIPPILTGGGRDPANEDYAPTAYAVALHEEYDRIIVAGRRPATNSDRPNVWCIRASDGVTMWSTHVTGLVQQHCIAIDPASGNVLVGFNRNQTGVWGGGAWAEMAEFDMQSGSLVRAWDFTADVTINGYITATYAACACYAVDVNSRGQVLMALAPFRYDT